VEPDKGSNDGPERNDPAWSTYTPPETAAPVEPPAPSTPPAVSTPPTPNIYGPPQTSSPEVARLFGTKPSSKAGCVIIPFVVILLVAIGVIVGVINAVSDSDDAFEFEFDEPSIELPDIDPSPPPPELHTVSGFNELLDALRQETGSTEVFEANLYPEYASLGVPAEPTGQRALSYFYNGELAEPSKGRSSYERFDLARIDPQVMLRLVQKAKRLVEDPTSWYVIIRKPGPPFDNGAWFSAYASNEFSESGYLQATLDGTIVNRYVSE
jgi:hypothetical protein